MTVSSSVMRVPSAKDWALFPMGSGAIDNGLAIIHSSTSITATTLTIVAVLRCCRLQ